MNEGSLAVAWALLGSANPARAQIPDIDRAERIELKLSHFRLGRKGARSGAKSRAKLVDNAQLQMQSAG